jgi:Flp pilus assembly protein TadD
MTVAGAVFLACSSSFAANPGTRPQGAGGQGLKEPQSGAAQPGSRPGGDPRALFMTGQTALQNGDLVGAEKAFRQVIAIDPSVAGAYSNLGVIAMRRRSAEYD